MASPTGKQQGAVPRTAQRHSVDDATTPILATPPPDNGCRSSPTKSLRRTANGSPITLEDPNKPAKIIYLIRHGQSWGQTAKQHGMDRKKDPRLIDCGLTEKGERQAAQIPSVLGQAVMDSVQLVVSSPLTRALQTSIIAFPSKNILVHFDLREVGSKVPENTPRSMEKVLNDLDQFLSYREEGLLLDVTTLKPNDWPRNYCPSVIMLDRIRKSFRWLYDEREENVMVIVCHYNVIRSAVTGAKDLRPLNATPLRCKLLSNGKLVFDE